MRRVLAILIAMMLVASVPVFGQTDATVTTPNAAPVVAEKAGIHPLIGVDTEFVINRTVDLEKSGFEADYSAQFYDLYTVIDFGGDLVILTPKIGIQTFQSTVNDITVGPLSIGDVDVNGGIGWNLGLDAQVNVLKTAFANAALIGSYRFSRTDVDEVNYKGLNVSNPIETIVTMHEWELGAKVYKDLSEIEALQGYIGKSLTPYLGLVYSDLYGETNANLSVLELNENFRAKDNFGLRTGISFKPTDDITLSLDAKFVDQTAIGASASFKF